MSQRQFHTENFFPKTEILVHTWRGDRFVLTAVGENAFIGWSSQKDTTSAGTFSITLTSIRDRNGLSWAEKILPMDYIEIRALADSQSPNAAPIVIMRGFVDSSEETLVFDQAEGGPARQVLISGTDYTKIYQMFQIQYLWQTNTKAYVLAQNPYLAFALDAFMHTGLLTKHVVSIPEYIGILDKKVLGHFTGPLVGHFDGKIPVPVSKVFIPSSFLVAPNYIENFTGSIWELYTYYQAPPWGELFVYDEPGSDAPTLLFRIAPSLDIEGNAPPALYDQFSLLPKLTLSSTELNAFTVYRSDSDVMNFFFSEGDTSTSNTLTFPFFVTGSVGESLFVNGSGAKTNPGSVIGPGSKSNLRPANPIINTDSISLYGFRPLTEQSPWFSGLLWNMGTELQSKSKKKASVDLTLKSVRSLAQELNYWLYFTYKDMASFLFGTITCEGRPEYAVGRYLVTDEISHEGKQEFYITSVQHTYTQFGTWTTQLGVSRGRRIA